MHSKEDPRVIVISLWAEDVPTTAAFYRDALGLEPFIPNHPHDKDAARFKLNGAHLIIMPGRPRPAANTKLERFPLFALAVDDLDEAIDRLREHGVPLPWGVEGHGQSRWVMFHDPAGNLIELA